MKRFISPFFAHRISLKSLSVFAVALCLSACSFSAKFVVINRTQEAITVRYEVKSLVQNRYAPMLVALSEFNAGNIEWRTFPTNRSIIDTDKGIVDVVLLPNEVLLAESTDAVLVAEDRSEWLNTNSLKITLANGSIDVKGNQVFEAFDPVPNSRFTFGPRVTRYEINVYERQSKLDLPGRD